jgi:hypothetical protein
MEINGHGDPLRWPRDTLSPQKLKLTSPTSDGRSVGIVRLRTTATEFYMKGRGRGWRPWSSGQSFWLQIQSYWVRFPVLPGFLRSSGSRTGSNQPREDNWGAT